MSEDSVATNLILPWERPLLRGTLLARRHRFLADIRLADGTPITAHCANPGGMESLVRPGAEVWVSENSNLSRSLRFTWELIRIDDCLVGANSWTANRLVKLLLERRVLRGLKRFQTIRTERPVGRNARVDFELVGKRGSHFVEVKNGHLVYPDGIAYFPDSLTVRSGKHIDCLRRKLALGHAATLIVTVQRSDAQKLRPSDLHDRAFARKLRSASKAGLDVRALKIVPTLQGFHFEGELEVDLDPYPVDEKAKWRDAMREFTGWKRPKGDPRAPWRRPRSSQIPRTELT